jgi:hypothetical protein
MSITYKLLLLAMPISLGHMSTGGGVLRITLATIVIFRSIGILVSEAAIPDNKPKSELSNTKEN